MPPVTVEDPSAVESLPKSSRVAHLPGCVLAPLPTNAIGSLHKLFTGHSECTEPWITRYIRMHVHVHKMITILLQCPVYFDIMIITL